MELDELIPERVSWTPTINGEKKDFFFRPFNLEDESFLKREFGDEKLKKIFEDLDMVQITRIAFRQLEVESKKELMKIKFIDVDEDGNDVEIAAKGPEKLSCLIVGLPEQLELVKMLLRTRGVSMPILDKLGEKIVEEQKEKAARDLLDKK